MRDWVAKEKKALVAPTKPDASAPHEASVQYEVNNGSHAEMKTVLDRFDTAISNLKSQYEATRGKIQGAAKEDLAALDAALKDAPGNDAATEKMLDDVAAAAAAKKAAEAKNQAGTAPAAPAKGAETKTEGVKESEFKPENPKEKRSAEAVKKNASQLDAVSKALSESDSKAKKSDLDETKRLLDEARKAPNDKNVRALQKDLVGYEGVKIAVDGEIGEKTIAALRSVAHVDAPKGAKKAPTQNGKPAAKQANNTEDLSTMA
jgi:hypothetical protein